MVYVTLIYESHIFVTIRPDKSKQRASGPFTNLTDRVN